MIIRAIIDARRPNRDGKFPVKIRITDRNKSAYISPGIYATPGEFNESEGLLFTGKKDTRAKNMQANSVIRAITERLDEILSEAKRKNICISPGRLKREAEAESQHVNFSGYFRKFTDGKTGKTKSVYEDTCKKITAHFGANVEFEDVTHAWLSTFEKRLKAENLKVNSISIHLRNIRAVYNDAITNEITGMERYPFRKFKIAHEKTRKRALTVGQLRTLFAYEGTEAENFAVDVAKLIFYLRGINIKDLFFLNECENGYVYYRRSKTGGLFAVKVEPEAQVLFDKYKGESHILRFCEQIKLHESFMKKTNDGLKRIAEKINIRELTTYVFRHTWATIAAELDIPKETIAAGLGHSQSGVTDIYIKFSQRKIDDANRRVIDTVNS